jgi:hypothetical protein
MQYPHSLLYAEVPAGFFRGCAIGATMLTQAAAAPQSTPTNFYTLLLRGL